MGCSSAIGGCVGCEGSTVGLVCVRKHHILGYFTCLNSRKYSRIFCPGYCTFACKIFYPQVQNIPEYFTPAGKIFCTRG